MARIDYADLQDAAIQPLVQRVAGARGSVLHLYRMLMHSDSVASGWLDYLSAIRHETTLDDAIRELVIMRVAYLNRAPYEADQHRPIARRAGLSERQLEAIGHDAFSAESFSDRERAVLAYTDAMTRDIQVEPSIFDALRAHFDDRGLVELTATVAAYNMVSRFLEALQVRSDDPT